MRNIVIILCVVIFLTGCRYESKKSIDVPLKRSIIFVPGFKGSRLADSNNSVVWVTAGEVFFGSRSVSIPNQLLGIRGEFLHPLSILDSISVIPGIYSYNVYGSFLDALRENVAADTEVVPFYYDWRLDAVESSHKLGELIEAKKSAGLEVDVIAHSMGGLLTAYYLRYGRQDSSNAVENWDGAHKVRKVIFAGTPFLGSLEIFDDMLIGGATGPNHSLLSAEAYGSFPSSYQLLPAPGIKNFFPENPDIHDVAVWEKNRWGLFHSDDSSEMILNARRNFMEECFTRSQKFFSLINEPSKQNLTLKVLTIIGKDTKTKVQFHLESGALDFENAHYEDGDQIVTIKSAILPDSFSAAQSDLVYVTSTHGALLNDPEAISKIDAFIVKN